MIYITILSIAALIAVIFAFKEGYKLGINSKEASNNKKADFVNAITSKVGNFFNFENDADNSVNDEERKLNIELENIDAYGTNKPQQEVK